MSAWRTLKLVPALLAVAAGHACAAPPPTVPPAAQAVVVLAKSFPAAGSTIRGSPQSLKLTFSPPARLNELKIDGPGGTMPMMVHAIGEVADYDVPLPELEPGSYSVKWKASAGGGQYSGSFVFTVRK